VQHTGRDKSFVYDLTIEPGTVRVRVASVPRSTEVQPGFVRFDTFHPPPTFLSLLSNSTYSTYSTSSYSIPTYSMSTYSVSTYSISTYSISTTSITISSIHPYILFNTLHSSTFLLCLLCTVCLVCLTICLPAYLPNLQTFSPLH
jgi:hypothetical protein